jgi:hypothetical protein
MDHQLSSTTTGINLKEEKPLHFNSLTLPPKNHNLFCEIGLKKGVGEKGKIRDH